MTFTSSEQVLLENALDLLLEVNHMKSLTEQIEHLILNEDDVERRHLLGKLVTSINMNIDAESREKDPLWFDGNNIPISPSIIRNGPFPYSDSDAFWMDSMYINRTIST